MQIIAKNKLTNDECINIGKLMNAAYAPENLEDDVHLGTDINVFKEMNTFFMCFINGELAAFLTLFVPTKQEAEITAFTHPLHRKQGLFAALCDAARAECEKFCIPSFLYAVQAKSESGNAAVKAIKNVEYAHSEYRMKLSDKTPYTAKNGFEFLKVTPKNKKTYLQLLETTLDELSDLTAFAAATLETKTRSAYMMLSQGLPVGVFHINEENGEAFLYDVGVMPCHRGKGYGKEMMLYAKKAATESGLPVVLDVDSENAAAFHIYKSIGFEITSQMDYYAENFG